MKYLKLIAVVVLSSTALVALAKPFHQPGGDGGYFRQQLDALELNATQQQSIEEILNTSRAEAKALRKSHRAFYQRLKSLDSAALSETEINELSEIAGRQAAEKFRHRLQTRAAIASVLTAEQREQLAEARESRKAEMRERWRKHSEQK